MQALVSARPASSGVAPSFAALTRHAAHETFSREAGEGNARLVRGLGAPYPAPAADTRISRGS
jgi:hypothetical protein